MKIIFLNLWHCRLLNDLSDFLSQHSKDTDIFCFQEADAASFSKIKDLFLEYKLFSCEKNIDEAEGFTLANFIRSDLSIHSHSCYMEKDLGVGLVLYNEIQIDNSTFHLCNLHGVARPDKSDNPRRILQSSNIIHFMKEKVGLKIIGGDLNVSPNTESVQLFYKSGYKNLIQDYNIKTTRNQLVWNRYPNNKLYYSDYVFVSPEIKVKSFSVPNIEISDHLPMILEFNL